MLHLKDLHCSEKVQKKLLSFSGMLRRARGEGESGWPVSNSCKSVARPSLTVNKYYILDIIRMTLALEDEDSRGDKTTDCA